jgi:cell division protein FtsB
MKKSKSLKVVFYLVFIVALFFIFFLAFGDEMKKRNELNELLTKKMEENAQLQAELDETREKLAKLQNPEYLEYIAREKGLGYDDEVVYIYPKEVDK